MNLFGKLILAHFVFFLFVSLFFQIIVLLCSPGQPEIHVVQASFNHAAILLVWSPEFWGYKHVPLHTAGELGVVYMYIHACGGQQSMLSVSLNCIPSYFF